jgi:hypothetical protein
MSFLNAILLAGGAAFLVPLLIHLFNRRRTRVVPWGAMHLLHEVIRQKKRRLKIEQWLLLATRIAIPLILALCLARPVLSFLRQLPGMASTSLIVVLDTSYSMRAPVGSTTLIQQAREDLERILQNLPQGSDVQVILAGGRPGRLLDEPTSVTEVLPEQLLQLPVHDGPLNVQDAMQAAMAEAGSSKNAIREILVISDFQRADWRRLLEGGSVPALEQLSSGDSPPAVTFYQIQTELESNLHFARVDVAPSILAPGQQAGLRVQIRGEGDTPWQDVAVHLEADGTRVKTARASVPADGETTLFFSHAFEDVGEHVLSVRMDGDTLLEDNVWREQVEIRDRLRILLIGGEPVGGAFGDSLDFLELALAPHRGASASLRDLIETTRTDARRVRKEDLAGYQVIVVGDVERFSRGDMTRALRSHVEQGGSLWVLPGDNADPAEYARTWYDKGKGLIPCTVIGEQHVPSTEPPARIEIQRYTHPVLNYFNGAQAAGLREVEVNHWWQLNAEDDACQVLMQLNDGSPLVVERKVGEGSLLFSAIPMDPDWSNLPLQPLFVPLAQRWVIYLALAGTGPTSVTVGESVQRLLDEAAGDSEWVFEAPDGTRTPAEIREMGGRRVAVTPPSAVPGVGRLVNKDQPDRSPILAVWNLHPDEGRIGSTPSSEVEDLAGRFNADYATGTDDYDLMDRGRRLGAEIWQPLLLAVLALLFFEVLLQQRITRP